MLQTIFSFLILALFSLPAEASAKEVDHKGLFQLWQKAASPASGPAASIGSYSAGCVAGAQKLEHDGTGYSVMRLSRKRYYGHPELVRYLRELGKAGEKAGLPHILVGDMGRPRGGPMISGHVSHQSGLDVDIWYRLSRKRPTRKERESWGASRLVSREGKVTSGWGGQQRKLVALAAASDAVDRIFVHAAIKKDLCQAFPDAPWLYKLRPWWGHDDHLHVRLKCPADSPNCEQQESVQALGPQCGQELDWWFTEEAREEWNKRRVAIGREFPSLPQECEKLVTDIVARKEERASP
jgi:penicillin-insensitive murein DD-endopeptidase